MFNILNIVLSIIIGASAATAIGEMEPVNYYQYTQIQSPLSWYTITSSAAEMAMLSCQESFKWQRWNCPSTDFNHRRTTATDNPDREDVFVGAITMVATIHKLTTDCANGEIIGCGCSQDASTLPCAHEPAKALQLYEHNFGANSQSNSILAHNQRVVGALLLRSLEQECRCKQLDLQGHCVEEECVDVLKPFEVIAQDLLQLYDDSVQLDLSAESHLKIVWKDIPLDTFVYVEDSPNYCEADDQTERWSGTRGRQCSKSGGAADERLSCTQLCRVCGHRVRSQHVRMERRCNCKLAWGFRLQCDTCFHLERQFLCY